jgi:sporulation protein YlmC with PRC-barrel domain
MKKRNAIIYMTVMITVAFVATQAMAISMGGGVFRKGQQMQGMHKEVAGTDQYSKSTSELICQKVVSKDGKEVGQVEDVVYSDAGGIDHLIVASGDDFMSIPYEAADINTDRDQITIMLAQAEMEKAPRINKEGQPYSCQ